MAPEDGAPRFLIIEDNPFALDIMSMYLQRLGHASDGAEHGQAGLALYMANPQRYRAVFMDLQMPVMGGYETARRLRSSGCPGAATLPLVAMSGDPLDNLHEYGFDMHLKKPFDMHAVAAALSALEPMINSVT